MLCRWRARALASAVAGLAAGICIGGLIAAQFAMLATEEKERKKSSRTAQTTHAPRHNRVIRDQPVDKDSFLSGIPAAS